MVGVKNRFLRGFDSKASAGYRNVAMVILVRASDEGQAERVAQRGGLVQLRLCAGEAVCFRAGFLKHGRRER